MARKEISIKHIALDKANTQMVAIVAVAAFLSIFSLVACKALWSQTRYQARVISAKEKANKQLQSNIKAVNSLVGQYSAFDAADPNIIGASKNGTGDNEGSNSKIILDALPSSYDFPALTSSIEKILTANGSKISGISGTDDQVNQETNIASIDPQPIPIPFTFTISDANYQSVQQLLDTLQRSIRPVQINKLQISGTTDKLSVSVEAQTFFQPAKSLEIKKQVVK